MATLFTSCAAVAVAVDVCVVLSFVYNQAAFMIAVQKVVIDFMVLCVLSGRHVISRGDVEQLDATHGSVKRESFIKNESST